jgi:hypothetical protein
VPDNAVTGQVALVAVAEWLRDYLDPVLVHDVAYSIGLQHLHGDSWFSRMPTKSLMWEICTAAVSLNHEIALFGFR